MHHELCAFWVMLTLDRKGNPMNCAFTKGQARFWPACRENLSCEAFLRERPHTYQSLASLCTLDWSFFIQLTRVIIYEPTTFSTLVFVPISSCLSVAIPEPTLCPTPVGESDASSAKGITTASCEQRLID